MFPFPSENAEVPDDPLAGHPVDGKGKKLLRVGFQKLHTSLRHETPHG
jgi:hypothetical protein